MPDPSPEADARLVARLLAHDGAAWRELIDLYGGAVAGSCRRALLRAGRPADTGAVDDAVAEVFRLLLEQDGRLLRRFRSGSPLLAYLRVIAWTKTLTRAMRAPRALPLDESRSEAPAPASADDEASGRVLRLRAALSRIPERDAQALRWFYEEDLSYAEIARRSGLGLAGVGMLLARAREKLKRAMEELP